MACCTWEACHAPASIKKRRAGGGEGARWVTAPRAPVTADGLGGKEAEIALSW